MTMHNPPQRWVRETGFRGSVVTENISLDDPFSNERRFQILVDAVVDYAIFMLDVEGRVSSWNTGAKRIKGYSADEIIGHHFSRFYTEADRAAGVPARALGTAAAEGKSETEGCRLLN